MNPTVSIITPWLDHPEFIADYERAVHAPGVEVIIVDNGSAAANARLLADMVQRLGGKYIRNDQNRWFAAANNQGLAVATGQVIVFLNNDIAADPTWTDAVRRDLQPAGLYGPELFASPPSGEELRNGADAQATGRHFKIDTHCNAGYQSANGLRKGTSNYG